MESEFTRTEQNVTETAFSNNDLLTIHQLSYCARLEANKNGIY